VTTTIAYDIQRQADGSADIACDRDNAAALRRQAAKDGRALRNLCTGLFAIIGAVAIVMVIADAPTPAARGLSSMAQTEAPQVW
jgi:hypothetical protein